MDKIKIIAVGGATASGKSALAMELAHRLSGEIVSCDSMQIYRGMDIGTAKPTADEMAEIRHHMIDVCEPDEDCSAAIWAKDASTAIRDIAQRGKVPIICGGTGMYLEALLRPTPFFESDGVVDDVRAALRDELDKTGARALYDRLVSIDPESAAAVHPNNVKRVLRCLEIYYTTGMTKSELDRMSLCGECEFDAVIVNVMFENRETLYSRINERVDRMVACGLEEEVRTLEASGKLKRTSTAAQAIGYREILQYFDGMHDLPSAIDLIKKNSRNYAKRQITWFRRYDAINVVSDPNGKILSSGELCDRYMSDIEKRI